MRDGRRGEGGGDGGWEGGVRGRWRRGDGGWGEG